MGKMSYYDMNRCLCKELCEEFEKFENDPKAEYMHGIHKIVETMVGLTELEAAGAMREYLEDEHGYNSRTGEFPERDWSMPHRVWNAAPMRTMPPYYMQSNDYDVMPGMNYDGGMYNRGGYPSERRGRDMGDMENRGRSRDSRGRYNEGYGVYNMAHERKKKLTDKEYKEWVDHMVDADGGTGGMWTKEETTAVARKIGIDFKDFSEADFHVAMDMVYSDYCEVFDKYGMDKPEIYAEIAKAWLCDEDTLQGAEKLAAYYEYVVKPAE